MIERIILPFKPRRHQYNCAMNMRRYNVWNHARRQGKSELAIQILVKEAISCPVNRKNNYFLFVGPDRTQTKKFAWPMLKRATAPIPGAKVNHTDLAVQLPNGAVVQILGAFDPSKFRGIGIGGVVIDEAQDVDASLWNEHLTPALATPIEMLKRGEMIKWFVIFLFTPRGDTFAYEMWKEGLTAVARAKGLDAHWMHENTSGNFDNDAYDKIISASPQGIPAACEWFIDRKTVEETGYLKWGAQEYANLIVGKSPEIVQQEYWCKFLLDSEGILFRKSWIEANRHPVRNQAEFWALVASMDRIVIGVDPKGSAANNLSYTGIIPMGIKDNVYYVFDDKSNSGYPDEWASAAIASFYEYGAATQGKMHNVEGIAAESNFGGDMVLDTIMIRDPNVQVYVKHASRGKIIRAEPMSVATQMNRVKFVLLENGNEVEDKLDALIEQMINYRKGKPSPDRMDAAVWAFEHLTSGVFNAHQSPTPQPSTEVKLPFSDAPPIVGMTQAEIWAQLTGKQ